MTLETQVVLDPEISQFTIILRPVDDQGTFIICNHCIQIVRVENIIDSIKDINITIYTAPARATFIKHKVELKSKNHLSGCNLQNNLLYCLIIVI